MNARVLGAGVTSALLAVLWALIVFAAPIGPSWRAARVIAQADSLFARNRNQAGFAYLDSLHVLATGRADGVLELGVRITHGRALTFAGDLARSRAELEPALAAAVARHDTLWWERASMSLALVALFEGNLRESTPRYRRALPLARRMGDREYESYAWMGLAYDAVLSGRPRESRDGYRRALAVGRGVIGTQASRTARIGLGRALTGTREYDAARAAYLGVLAEARVDGDRFHEGQALNNLGATESVVGDPAEAARYYEQAAEAEASFGRSAMASTPLTNAAIALTEQGRLEEAAAIFEREAATLEALGANRGAAAVRTELGSVRRLEGRWEESERLFRGSVALGDNLSLLMASNAMTGLAEVLSGRGRWTEALDSLAKFEGRHAGGVLEYPDDSFERIFVECLLAVHRPREALARAARARREGEALGIATGWAPLREAQAWRALGRADSALSSLRRSALQWTAWRGRSLDLGWRATRGAAGAAIGSELADLLLDSPPGHGTAAQARAVFNALQPFKARTLEERMRGPLVAAGMEPRELVSAERLQRVVLREGELFLDYFVADERTILVAITRQDTRAVRLPGARVLAMGASRLRDLASAVPAVAGAVDAAALCDSAGLTLGNQVLGPVADLVRNSRCVMISADAMLADLPFGAMLLDSASGGAPAPLLTGRDVVLVPSATLLAGVRARAGARGHASRKLLVLARTTDAARRPLPGVNREARWLGHALVGAEVRARHGEASVAGVAGDLARYEVLHIAAHTGVDPTLPWRSGILIGADAPSAGDPYLRASAIAGLRLNARLCVLSGCSSAGTASPMGEGLQGLSSAFVSAGVPTVIATLWPVDDATTAELVERFYRRLASGMPASASLRVAQLEIRARAATRHPFYWAGFVLVGEPSTRVALRLRPGS